MRHNLQILHYQKILLMNKWLVYIVVLSGILTAQGQVDSTKQILDSIRVAKDSVIVSSDSIDFPLDVSNFEPFNNVVLNESALGTFFQKLLDLQQNKRKKVRIVHLGDSHIQADLFTAMMRKRMQSIFGNAGFGFTFPYSVANTNNSAPIRYHASGGSFTAVRNLFADASKPVGLSGIALQSKSSNFAIQLQVKDPQYYFTKVQLITPQNQNLFSLSFEEKKELITIAVPKKITHKVKSGEVLGSIAEKYGVTLKQLKKANSLKNDFIRDGKLLTIPSKQTKPQSIFKTSYVPVALESALIGYQYKASKPLDQVTLIPNEGKLDFALNGIVLENDAAGVIYSGIGVNGAKCSDYNKFPMFFEQLPVLEADLVIISLGTNESFDRQEALVYMNQLQTMLNAIKNQLPNVAILVTTPPPSVLHRKEQNSYIESYSQTIRNQAQESKYAVWDLLAIFGGNKNIKLNARMGLLAKDKVHYSKLGYEKQAELLFEALMQSFELYKSEK